MPERKREGLVKTLESTLESALESTLENILESNLESIHRALRDYYENMSERTHVPCKCYTLFLSDPGIPGVLSMGPSLCPSLSHG